MNCDSTEIERSLRLLVGGGQTFELRALGKDRGREVTWSGFFVDTAQAAAAIPAIADRAKGVYFTLNPVRPEIRARRADRIEPASKGETTSDHNVARRTRLLIDIDADRPAGISSSNAEHNAAITLAKEVAADLVGMGWPEPLIADSGNGAHLVFGIDLPADDDGLIARVLDEAAKRWSCDIDGIRLKVDTTVANPARISKVYGTVTRKGDDMPDRPHRMARILSTPDALGVVATGLLEAFAPVAVKAAQVAPRHPVPRGEMQTLDAAAWLSKHGIEVKGTGPNKDGGTVYELAVCPNNPDHDRGEAFVIQLGSGAIAAGCRHESCKWVNWTWLREKYDGPREVRRPEPRQPQRSSVTTTLTGVGPDMIPPVRLPTAEDFKTSADRVVDEARSRLALVEREMPFHHMFLDDILRGILPHDLIILGAVSGAGKTELAQSISMSNALKGKRVHYFALEAEPLEIERRTKFKLLSGLAKSEKRPFLDQLNYPDWYRGKCEHIVGTLNEKVERGIKNSLGTFHTYYRGANFGPADIKRMMIGIRDSTDLIVIDHLHYVDTETDNENREYRDILKMVRDVSLRIGRPVILVVHLRKRDKRFDKTLVPDLESVHGSSEIYKIATHSIMLAPAREIEQKDPWLAGTYFSVPKDRMGGATGLIGLCTFDVRTRTYEDRYTLGRQVGDAFEPLDINKLPRWATHHRPLYAPTLTTVARTN